MSLHCLKNYKCQLYIMCAMKLNLIFHKLYEFNRGVNIDFALINRVVLQLKDLFNMASSVLLNCMIVHSLVLFLF